MLGSKLKLQLISQKLNTLHVPSIQVFSKNKSFKNNINTLRQAASTLGACYLAANQLGLMDNLFVCLPRGLLVNDKWKGYRHQPHDYKTIVNCKIVKNSVEEEERYEQSLSIPGCRFLVKRPASVLVHSVKENLGLPVEQDLQKFQARVWQQAVNQLQGEIISDVHVSKGNCELFNPASDSQISELRRNLITLIKAYEAEQRRLPNQEKAKRKLAIQSAHSQLIQMLSYQSQQLQRNINNTNSLHRF